MSKQKRCFLLLLAVLLLLPHLSIRGTAQNDELLPDVSAQSAVLMEAESGNVAFEKNAHKRLPIASTTKIATALTALELAPPETIISVSSEAVGVEGSSVYLTENETLTLEQLLYALLLESANDAAVAIAVGLCDSVEAFAAEMNKIVAALGLKDTHFVNPHGLDHEDHYSTAYEMALLTRHAMKNERLKTIVSTRKTTIPHASTDGARLLVNHNKLLRLYDGCIGVKTGFTKHSGRCLVSAAEREGVTLIAVTLNAPSDWNDHTAMLDYGFSRYRSVLLAEKDALIHRMPIVGGTQEEVLLCNPEELRITLPVTHGSIRCVVEASHFSYAPVYAGENLGVAVFYCDTNRDGIEERVAETPLLSCNTVTKPIKKGFWQWLRALFGKD
ncbi:MAG: D-alanyl-D-alanine carboxypeptidase [Clostridia bacterium]|nr:D-alanyl-D-alanine carboxypeptidase [Clostridia bacterium]